MPLDGTIGPYLILTPAEGAFNLLVALLNAPATLPPKRQH